MRLVSKQIPTHWSNLISKRLRCDLEEGPARSEAGSSSSGPVEGWISGALDKNPGVYLIV